MSAGRLVAVVGPSGVGKDSVMAGIAALRPEIAVVRRVITRAPGLGGETYEAVSEAAFEDMAARGAFCLHWRAHGLRYGIPVAALHAVLAGAARMANLSRDALSEAASVFPAMVVLNITASPAVLAQRLTGRGRESRSDIETRLARAAHPLPEGLEVITVNNDGPLEDTVARAAAALQPTRA